jgi:hypothetical protein
VPEPVGGADVMMTYGDGVTVITINWACAGVWMWVLVAIRMTAAVRTEHVKRAKREVIEESVQYEVPEFERPSTPSSRLAEACVVREKSGTCMSDGK